MLDSEQLLAEMPSRVSFGHRSVLLWHPSELGNGSLVIPKVETELLFVETTTISPQERLLIFEEIQRHNPEINLYFWTLMLGDDLEERYAHLK